MGKKKRNMRRKNPPKWNEDRYRQAFELALLGLTEDQMAPVMNISLGTIEYWKRKKPSFLNALNEGKSLADAKVAHSLFQRAVGYSHPDVHILSNRVKIFDEYGKVIEERTEPLIVDIIKHYPPDSYACQKWLALRQRAKWADTQKLEISGEINHNHVLHVELDDISTEELELMEKIGLRQLMIENRDN